MAKKIIVILFTVILFIMTVQAEILAPCMNSPTRIALLGAETYIKFARTYGQDGVSQNYVAPDYACPAYALWLSNMYAETIYKMTVTMPNYGFANDVTGFMEHTDDFAAYIIPAENMLAGLDLSESKYGQNQTYNPTWTSFETYRLPNDQYEIFWDTKNKQLSCLFYNDSTTTNAYIMIRLGTWEAGNFVGSIPINPEITKGPQGIYTDILKDIKQILQEFTGEEGNGITEEQVNQAIQDALTAHDQQLQQEVSGKLDQILDQISGITGPYKQAVDKITGALNNVNNIFSATDFTAKLTLPSATNPLAGNAVLWQAQQIDLAAAYMSLPAAFRTLFQYALRASVLLAAIREVISIIKYAIIGRGEQVD